MDRALIGNREVYYVKSKPTILNSKIFTEYLLCTKKEIPRMENITLGLTVYNYPFY